MAAILVRTVAALLALQTLWLLFMLPFWDLPLAWKIGICFLVLVQALFIWRLWALRRWAVVYMIAETALKLLLIGSLRDATDLGWKLYYLLMCITLAVVATLEGKQLKSGV